MCWSHTYRNVWPKLARKEIKELGKSILSDIEEEFEALTSLLKEHYCSLATLTANKLSLVKTFFSYFLTQCTMRKKMNLIFNF